MCFSEQIAAAERRRDRGGPVAKRNTPFGQVLFVLQTVSWKTIFCRPRPAGDTGQCIYLWTTPATGESFWRDDALFTVDSRRFFSMFQLMNSVFAFLRVCVSSFALSACLSLDALV
jgi:hypothetical protein